MIDQAPASPFLTRHQFLTRFVSGEARSPEVQGAIEYADTAPSELRGVVLGGLDASRVVFNETRRTTGHYHELRLDEPGVPIRFWSDTVHS